MKITETIERECCHPKDLIKMLSKDVYNYRFCKYCGRHFTEESIGHPSGNGYETVWSKIKFPWEK